MKSFNLSDRCSRLHTMGSTTCSSGVILSTHILTFAQKVRQRVFAHYVLGRLAFLFFICHPGTLATFGDCKSYLQDRYPNRELSVLHTSCNTNTRAKRDERKFVVPETIEDAAQAVLSASKTHEGELGKIDLTYLAFVAPRPFTSRRRRTSNCSMVISSDISHQFKDWPNSPQSTARTYDIHKPLKSNEVTVIKRENHKSTLKHDMNPFHSTHLFIDRLVEGATETFDSAANYVSCTLITHPISKKIFGEPVNEKKAYKKPGKPLHPEVSSFDLVGFMDVDIHRSFY